MAEQGEGLTVYRAIGRVEYSFDGAAPVHHCMKEFRSALADFKNIMGV